MPGSFTTISTACQYSIMKTIKMYEDARNQCLHDSLSGRIATIRSEQENRAVHDLFVATYGHGIEGELGVSTLFVATYGHGFEGELGVSTLFVATYGHGFQGELGVSTSSYLE